MADISNLIDEYFYHNQNIKPELYLEFISNIISKYKYINRKQIINYSIKKFFQEVNNIDILLDFVFELLEINICDKMIILKEIVTNFVINYNDYNVERFLYFIIEIRPDIIDIIQYRDIFNGFVKKEQIQFIYNIYNIRKEINKYFSNINTIHNENDLKIFNFLENFPEEMIFDEDILFYETLMGYIDFNLGNAEQFIEMLIEQEFIGEEISNFCNYITKNYEYYDKNNNFIFKDLDNSLITLLDFLLDTKYLDLNRKISCISNICYKVYINDLKNGTVYLEDVKNFFSSKTEYKEIYNKVCSNICCLEQKDAACTLYNKYKDTMMQKKDKHMEFFIKNIENCINFFDTKYNNCNFFITELYKIGEKNKDDYLLNTVQSIIIYNTINSFNDRDMKILQK